MKSCSKCLQQKEDGEYYVRTNGNLHAQCKTCMLLQMRERYRINPEPIKLKTRRRSEDHPDRKKQEDRAYYEVHRVKKIAWQMEYTQRNKDSVRARQRYRDKERRAIDPTYRLIRNLRKRTRNALYCQSAKKACGTKELLGCSATAFKEWIQSRLQVGMRWDNYGPVWNLDHTIPCTAWDLKNPEHIRACFHWTNVLPLWSAINFSKSGAQRYPAGYFHAAIAERLLVVRALT